MTSDPPPCAPTSGAEVGSRLRVARRRSGWTLRRLATELGVSPATLSQLENGRTRLSVERLAQAAHVIGTTVQDILTPPAGEPPVAEALPEEQPSVIGRRLDAGTALPADQDWRHYPPLEFDPVLTAALAEFVQAGYHGTSIRDIARRCGLSASGIYHYYSSKQEMLTTLLQFAMEELLWRGDAARRAGADPAQRFCLLIEHLVLFHTYRLELGFVGASEMRSLLPGNRRAIAAMRNEQQHMIDTEVEAAVEGGQFDTRRSHEAARAVVTMCTALPTWFHLGGTSSPEDVAADYVQFGLDLMRYRTEELDGFAPGIE